MYFHGSILVFIFDISVVFLSSLVYLWVVYKILSPKKPMRFFSVPVIILAVTHDLLIQSLEAISFSPWYNTLPYAFDVSIPLIYAIIYLKGSFIQKLTIVITISLIASITGSFFVGFWMFFGFSYESMHDSIPIYICTGIVVHALNALSEILFAKICKKVTLKLKQSESTMVMIMILLLLLFSVISIHTTNVINDPVAKIYTMTSVILVIIAFAIMLYIINRISKNNYIKQENILLKMEKNYQKQQYDDIIRQSEQISKLRHDYKNNFLVIRSLISDNNNAKALEIINKDIEQINMQRSHVKTNNEVVNAILNTKISIAAEKGIKVSIISISDFDEIDDFDLCNLISNMFDNAIRATQDCDEKLIEITISRKNDYYIFKMSNTIKESVIKANPYLETTKGDKSSHGLGMKIIKDIADNYHGDIDYYEEDGRFNVLVHMAVLEPVRVK